MKPQISEFSYGFALTNEMVGWTTLSTAPVFPSLIEEGKTGGGYDVKLELPGAPLFLQFKRSHWMTRRSAREYRLVTDDGGSLDVPYYRFPITESDLSDQHEMLLELDDGAHLVFYAAPRFHRKDEINSAWSLSEVAERSIFVAPQEIGPLDSSAHTVAFDDSNTWVCSTPKQVIAFSGTGLHGKMRASLEQDDRPLEARISTLIEEMRGAEDRGRQKARDRRRRGAQQRFADRRETDGPDILIRQRAFEQTEEYEPTGAETAPTPEVSSDRPSTRDPKPLKEHEATLREASDIAARVFDAQLLIVQEGDQK